MISITEFGLVVTCEVLIMLLVLFMGTRNYDKKKSEYGTIASGGSEE